MLKQLNPIWKTVEAADVDYRQSSELVLPVISECFAF